MMNNQRRRFPISCNRKFLCASALLVFSLVPAYAQQNTGPEPGVESTVIDAHAAATPFPHFWEQMFGSGRANLAMREDYRRDLRMVKAISDFRYVRFHAIFHDENGVYYEDEHSAPVYNWSYVDRIYDGLLHNGVRPFVEVSFMPKALASQTDYHPFWYRPITSPPKDYTKWDKLIAAFAQHLVDRYGIDEVAQWYFEVWNEPNIGFWTGHPAQQTYFELYDHTARTLKSVSPRLRVGGPATAQAAWVGEMIAHATETHVPLDFVSTHVYGNDSAQNVFHDDRTIPPRGMVCEAVKKVHEEIAHSAAPQIPLIWSEFNASYANEPQITDSIYMGPWLANTIRRCDGLTEMMSYWTFSDVFEESGPVKTPFYGGFGLIAAGGVKKPSFYAFSILHKLGEERLTNPADNLLVTRHKNGALVVAAWNLADADHAMQGASITLKLVFKGVLPRAVVSISRVDETHGNPLPTYRAMGTPQYPTETQIAELNRSLPAPERKTLTNGELQLTLPVNGLAVIEIPAW
jgi:xylan 1,4-beta-xylosidase